MDALTLSHRVQNDFHRAAERYDQYASLQRRICDESFQFGKDKIIRSNTILDAGCGTGYFHECLRKYGHHQDLIQLDIAASMCRIANLYKALPTHSTTWTVQGDVQRLPLKTASVDLIFSSLTLQWVPDLTLAFQECHRVLAPGGNVIFSTLLPGTLQELASAFRHVGLAAPIMPFVPATRVVGLLKDEGFQPVREQTHMLTHYYPSAYELLSSFKKLGAQYKLTRPYTYIGKNKLSVMLDYYEELYKRREGVASSWHSYIMVATKAT